MIQRFLELLLLPFQALFRPEKLITAFRRVSMPTWSAVFTFFVCLLLILLAFIDSRLAAHASESGTYWNKILDYWFLITLLVLILPILVYHTVRVWLLRDRIPYPDLERAWWAGLAALDAERIDFSNSPLFLILGEPDAKTIKNIVKASGRECLVQGVPADSETPNPLVWYATDEAVYLFIRDAGCLSALSESWTRSLEKPASQGTQYGGASIVPGGKSIDLNSPAGPAPGSESVEFGQLGSHDPNASMSEPPTPFPGASMSFSEGSPGGAGNRTITPGSGGFSPGGGGGSGRRSRPATSLTAEEQMEGRQRLTFVAQLCRDSRAPVIPINGILCILPLDLLEAEAGDDKGRGGGAQAALDSDVETLRDITGTRCTVRVALANLAKDPGFDALRDRLVDGRKTKVTARLGKGVGPWFTPEEKWLRAAGEVAVGTVEGVILDLFQVRGALQPRGASGLTPEEYGIRVQMAVRENQKLFQLLCKLRRVRPQLARVLSGALRFDPDRMYPYSWSFLAGTYFIAAGDSPKQKAFVGGLFDTWDDEKSDALDWTPEARDANARRMFWAYLLFLGSGLAAIGLAVVGYLWIGAAGGN